MELAGLSSDGEYRIMHDLQTKVVIEMLSLIYHMMDKLENLTPRKEVNELFEKLVALCIKKHHPNVAIAVLDSVAPVAERLRQFCADGEAALEQHWAKFLLGDESIGGWKKKNVDDDSDDEDGVLLVPCVRSADDLALVTDPLRLFPYYKNYVDLCKLEEGMLTVALPHQKLQRVKSICFIGSGPLPLSAFRIAADIPMARIHNIDRDEAAIKLSEELAKKLGYDKMTFECEDAEKVTSLRGFDVVWVGALVGSTEEEKATILKNIGARMLNGALMVVRSAYGLRTLLYPVRVQFSWYLCLVVADRHV